MPLGRPYNLTPNVATKNVTITATASQTSFTPSGGYRIDEIVVYRNGVRLVSGQDFTATDGVTVTLQTPASDGDVVSFSIFDSFNVANTIKPNESDQTINGNLTLTGMLTGGGVSPGQWGKTAAGINTSVAVGVGTTRPDSIARVNNTTILNAGIVTAYKLYGDLTGDVTGDLTGDVTGNVSGTSGGFSGNPSVNTTGIITAASANFTGNVTIGGTLTYDDVTNIDSLGIITAQNGINVSGGNVKVNAGIVTVGTGVTISSDFIHLTDNAKIQLGIASDLTIVHTGSHSDIIDSGTGNLRLQSDKVQILNAAASEQIANFTENGAVELYYDNSKKIETVGTGVSIYGGMKIQSGLLRESVNIVATALNSNKVINLTDGMVHYRSVAVGAANVKLNVISTAGINTDLAIGDAMAVTVMTVAGNTAHYVDQIRIDGVEASAGVTTHWAGGSVPSAGGGSGVDTYTFNILKTGNATYVVVANQTLTS